MPKTILLLTHLPTTASSDTGILGQALQDLGHTIKTHKVQSFASDGSKRVDADFPPYENFDAVIAFGAAEHAYDTSLDWIAKELDYISALHRHGIPYLGICFGSQLLAQSLGGRTVPADSIELGLITLEPLAPCPVATGPWLSWHGDKVELPKSVDVLAKTSVAPQIFRSGSSIGVQFHPEVNTEMLEAWIRQTAEEPEGILLPKDLQKEWAEHEPLIHKNARDLLDWFLSEMPTSRTGSPALRPSLSREPTSPGLVRELSDSTGPALIT